MGIKARPAAIRVQSDARKAVHRHRSFAAFFLLLALSSNASPQDWPTRSIRVIVPFPAGGGTDIVARTVCGELAKRLRQPCIVENRPGAGGTIGTALVVRAEPDGHTILVHSSTHTIAAAAFTNLPYDAAVDLAAVIPLGSMSLVLVTAPTKRYQTVNQIVAAARAKPGAVSYASTIGASTHFVAEAFRLNGGFEAVNVPYKGAPEALPDVVAGRVDFFFSPLLPALPLLADHKLTALAVTGLKRASALSSVPTLAEAGYANIDYSLWNAMFVPAKTPRSIVNRLYAASLEALTTPEVQERLAKVGIEPMPMTSEELDLFIKNEITVNAATIKAAGMKVE